MKLFLTVTVLVLIVSGCQRDPLDSPTSRETDIPIRVDSSFVPPVEEIKYYSDGAYFFEYADTGRYIFSADTVGNEFKVNILLERINLFGTDSSRFIYYYDISYHLSSIVRNNFDGSKQSIKLFYSGDQLERFEEWTGNTKDKTYTVSYQSSGAGKRLSIAPYVTGNGAGITDTISHSLLFNTQGKMIEIQERLRRIGSLNQLWTTKLGVTYAGNDVTQLSGYRKFDIYAPETPRVDSIVTMFAYTRESGESTVLADYMEKIYGKEFYAILNYCDLLQLPIPGVRINLLRLPGQNKSSAKGYDYIALVYTNGGSPHLQTATYTSQNFFDSEHRLIKSKVNSTPPNYFTWEISYR